MDQTELLQFIDAELLILVPVLWIVGAIVKRTPKIPDWAIPYALVILGVILAGLMKGFTAGTVAQGIIAAGVAVLGHQLIKQPTKKE